MSMTNCSNRVEVITAVQRRRRWTASEKVRMVEETFEPGITVSLVARRHGLAPNQLFTWRRLVAQSSLTAAGSGEEVVPASEYRTLQNQVRELHRLLGKKTLTALLPPPDSAREPCCKVSVIVTRPPRHSRTFQWVGPSKTRKSQHAPPTSHKPNEIGQHYPGHDDGTPLQAMLAILGSI